jgi:hypothetical protein
VAQATATVTSREGRVVAIEWWERVALRWTGFRAAHLVGWSRVARVRAGAMWAAFLVVVLLLAMSGTYRNTVRVFLSCLVLLVWWHALARTKTLSWRVVSLVLSVSILWAPVVALVTTKLSGQVAEALDYPLGGVGMAGASTAIAGFGEESLKLVPVLVLVLLAPGRVRRFATVDWLLVGFASGLGFQLFEDGARRLARAVVKPGLFDMIFGSADQGPGSGFPQYGLGPLAGGSSQGTGLQDISYAGHHVFTALVAVGIGLGIAAWRHSRTPAGVTGRPWLWRVVAVAVPAGLFWVVVVDHFAYNASAASSDWAGPTAEGKVSTVPVVLRWSWQVLGHGFGRGWLLIALLVVAMLIDARRTAGLAAGPAVEGEGSDLVPGVVRRFGDRMPGRPGAVARAVRDLVVLVWADLATVLVAHHRNVIGDGQGPEPRTVAARRGLAVAVMLRWDRAEQVDVVVNPVSVSAREVRAGWWRVRVLALCALVLVAVIALWLAPTLAGQIGDGFTRTTGSTWLAGVLDALGGWWDGLSPGAQIGALIVVGAIVGLATGGLGTALFVSGVAGYGLSHAHGLASLTRNPRAAVRGYVTSLTPQGAVLDALDLGLTFIPVGAGAVAGRGVKAAVGEFAKDPDAWRAGRQIALREGAEAGTVRFDEFNLKRPNTWREVIGDWKDGYKFNVDQWNRYEANEITLGNGKRLDSYAHEADIVSRKNSQLADLEPSTALAYLREHGTKYSPGEIISDTARARTEFPHLIGEPLDGKSILEVPVQVKPVPRGILDRAEDLRIVIRDIAGHVYR